VFKTTPLHDWSSHDADSFRGLCMAWKNQIVPPGEEEKPPVKAITDRTMDEMWKLVRPKRERVLVGTIKTKRALKTKPIAFPRGVRARPHSRAQHVR
jgi:hypothetical protein